MRKTLGGDSNPTPKRQAICDVWRGAFPVRQGASAGRSVVCINQTETQGVRGQVESGALRKPHQPPRRFGDARQARISASCAGRTNRLRLKNQNVTYFRWRANRCARTVLKRMAEDYPFDRDAILKRFGTHLRRLRLERGLTQEQLAMAIEAGFSRSYYTEIETGKRNVSLLNLYKLAECLQVSLIELVDFNEAEEG